MSKDWNRDEAADEVGDTAALREAGPIGAMLPLAVLTVVRVLIRG